jgi:hypothetical protein
MAYIVSLYARGQRIPADCLADFYDTRQAAEEAAGAEVARVAAIEPEARVRTLDWAVRYSIRKVKM